MFDCDPSPKIAVMLQVVPAVGGYTLAISQSALASPGPRTWQLLVTLMMHMPLLEIVKWLTRHATELVQPWSHPVSKGLVGATMTIAAPLTANAAATSRMPTRQL